MKKPIAFLAAALLSGAAHAADYSFTFGNLLTGSSGVPAAGDFATLDISGSSAQWTFTLSVKDSLASIFGAGSFVGYLGTGPSFSAPAFVSGGVSDVFASTGNGPNGSGVTDRFEFGKGSKADRLVAGETVTWTSSGPVDPAAALALHVQGIGAKAEDSGWYLASSGGPVTPVPEPEAYAMLLAGLGMVGAIARRRQRSA